jgi:pyrimidine-nucleoside phosphorylase
MVVPRLIERKRSGQALRDDEWRELVAGYTAGTVPDYQMSALLMAVMFKGLTHQELAALTGAMLDSGARFTRTAGGAPRVDKHSTGGVGDKTSLILAPLLAACGVAVPMMSGRGLGHTGGTLDKLEAIPGFTTQLSLEAAARQLDDIGVVMLGQTEEIVPADRKLYALRDVTGTVESIPLITASIMSKKLAEALDGLVLDVKVGSGAFIPEPARARELARTMVAVGERAGCRTVALLTAMDRPLGRTAGNALEVREAVEALKGEGRADLLEVTLALGVAMLRLARPAVTAAEAMSTLRDTIASGAALERMAVLVERQGGDPRVLSRPELLPVAPVRRELTAAEQFTMPPLSPRAVGELIVELGGGRRIASDTVNPAVGIEFPVMAGAPVDGDAQWAVIHAQNEAAADHAGRVLRELLDEASRSGGDILPLVMETISAGDLEPPEGA